MTFRLTATPDPECTPAECELLHELCVLVWAGREAERRGHAPRVVRDVSVSAIRVEVVRITQLELFG